MGGRDSGDLAVDGEGQPARKCQNNRYWTSGEPERTIANDKDGDGILDLLAADFGADSLDLLPAHRFADVARRFRFDIECGVGFCRPIGHAAELVGLQVIREANRQRHAAPRRMIGSARTAGRFGRPHSGFDHCGLNRRYFETGRRLRERGRREQCHLDSLHVE